MVIQNFSVYTYYGLSSFYPSSAASVGGSGGMLLGGRVVFGINRFRVNKAHTGEEEEEESEEGGTH